MTSSRSLAVQVQHKFGERLYQSLSGRKTISDLFFNSNIELACVAALHECCRKRRALDHILDPVRSFSAVDEVLRAVFRSRKIRGEKG